MDILIMRALRVCAVEIGILAFAIGISGCKPDLDERASELGAPVRVLAVQADPAEGVPGDAVTFRALVVDATGTEIEAPASSWGFCTARKSLAELGPVSPACYTAGSGALSPLGSGTSVQATLSSSACRDFGPEVPQSKPGEYGRPVDPDPTGGYYQPVTFVAMAGSDWVTAVETTRIACGLSGASSDDVITFRQRYHLNENPGVLRLRATDEDIEGESAPIAVTSGMRVTMTVEWPACPDVDVCGDGICGPDESQVTCTEDCAKPNGCMGAERYLVYDAEARGLVVHREAMSVSWFASAGSFDQERTGREADDPATSSDNIWQAPTTPRIVKGWVVLRDERGGTAWQPFVFDVR
ncbi:MAG: hypothetical protein FWD73_09835 [Polyangiaceae bacterium]|nr:hypothetical protein [Polyangiaceae bacterium]